MGFSSLRQLGLTAHSKSGKVSSAGVSEPCSIVDMPYILIVDMPYILTCLQQWLCDHFVAYSVSFVY